MNHGTAVACALALLVAGCATRGSVRQVGEDLRALQGEVGALRQSQEDLSRRLAEMASSNRAELAASIAAVKADVERLSAKVQATDEAVKEVKETLAARASAPPPPALQGAKPARASSAEAAFTAGLTNFRNREYGQAVIDFLDVVTKHPRHELASNAQYLIAEAYYLKRDYRQALAEFQRTIEWPAPHAKVADSLLKAGLCHSHLRESMAAQLAWRRVVREFPEAPAAGEARVLLAGKKSPSPSARRH